LRKYRQTHRIEGLAVDCLTGAHRLRGGATCGGHVVLEAGTSAGSALAPQSDRRRLADLLPIVLGVAAEMHDADPLHELGDTLSAIRIQQRLMEGLYPSMADISHGRHVECFAKASLQCA